VIAYLSALGLALLAPSSLSATDLTVDAVTRATTANPMVGDVASLTDGRTPDDDPEAPAVEWSGVGLLIVAWPQPVRLATIRMYVVNVDRYGVYGYLGGSYTDTGQRLEVDTPAFLREGLVPVDVEGWYSITCDPEVSIDNLGLQVLGSALVYEVQFLGPDGTAIQSASFGTIKRGVASTPSRK